MTPRITAVCAGALLTAAALGLSPAHALSMQECSAKYKAAQQNNTLNGMKWNDFRKAEFGADAAAAAPATTPATTRATTASAPPSAAATTRSGNAIYPTAVSPKYSKESEGKARMHTCLDQYNANKAGNGNGGMTWIQKGGGYYSECNKRLKG
jgi:hypothetical protein